MIARVFYLALVALALTVIAVSTAQLGHALADNGAQAAEGRVAHAQTIRCLEAHDFDLYAGC